ncbi:ParB/RepB/Spo0J family partition protein [Pseudooceanicola sp. C21-150M6]|uniref:ParB/RepB/Spo0J family partition protein n=1 Tax=Pseudooceanicola sp. C21-150M6 TaxID=3434355 RepID=UPI003D7F225C
MAKRKRLTPANMAFLETPPEAKSPMAAPIADVARDASVTAAAEEMSRTLIAAREEGRMLITVPIGRIRLDYLVRDRIVSDSEEMQALKDSLRQRGQQTPVELVDLGEGDYGLISGWRRCAALTALQEETGEAKFGEVLALLRRPADSASAYLAMVEENEIRAGLSYFERARIVAKSVEQGVFETDRAALQTLFAAASRPRRSKIGSFVPVVAALDGWLRHPEAIGERLGLALSRALTAHPDLGLRLRHALSGTEVTGSETEIAVIEQALERCSEPKPGAETAPPSRSDRPGATGPSEALQLADGLVLQRKGTRLVLSGARVDDELAGDLEAWLRQRL